MVIAHPTPLFHPPVGNTANLIFDHLDRTPRDGYEHSLVVIIVAVDGVDVVVVVVVKDNDNTRLLAKTSETRGI